LLLTLAAVLGVCGAAVWLLALAGLVQPLIVISDSMAPGISRGDLLIATRTETEAIRVGDVVSVPGASDRRLVTHRVVAVEPSPAGGWTLTLRGDANQSDDPEPYTVGGSVLRLEWTIPGAGTALERLARPQVLVPLGVALGALAALAAVRVPAPPRVAET